MFDTSISKNKIFQLLMPIFQNIELGIFMFSTRIQLFNYDKVNFEFGYVIIPNSLFWKLSISNWKILFLLIRISNKLDFLFFVDPNLKKKPQTFGKFMDIPSSFESRGPIYQSKSSVYIHAGRKCGQWSNWSLQLSAVGFQNSQNF